MKTLLVLLIVIGAGYLYYFEKRKENQANEALIALEALGTATHIGLPIAEYSKRTIDTAIIVDRALPSISDPQRRKAVSEVMETYSLASSFWSAAIQRSSPELRNIEFRSRQLGVDLDLNQGSNYFTGEVPKYWSVASDRVRNIRDGVYRDYALSPRPKQTSKPALSASAVALPKATPTPKPGAWMWKGKGTALDKAPY